MALQREPLLTMFYTINLYPLLVTKKGFMLIIILSNYQKCPLPLTFTLFLFGIVIQCLQNHSLVVPKGSCIACTKFECFRNAWNNCLVLSKNWQVKYHMHWSRFVYHKRNSFVCLNNSRINSSKLHWRVS